MIAEIAVVGAIVVGNAVLSSITLSEGGGKGEQGEATVLTRTYTDLLAHFAFLQNSSSHTDPQARLSLWAHSQGPRQAGPRHPKGIQSSVDDASRRRLPDDAASAKAQKLSTHAHPPRPYITQVISRSLKA